jgi:tetratricopeptide (TPR) repeat protein
MARRHGAMEKGLLFFPAFTGVIRRRLSMPTAVHRWIGVAIVVFLAFGTACSRDPEVLKRQYLEAGDRFVAEGKHAEAILEYRNAIRLDTRLGEARSKLSASYEAVRDLPNALREAVRAADLMPDSVEAQLRAGSLLLRARQFPEARARAVSALAKEPRNPVALILLGNALASLKDLDAAIEQVEQAIDEDPQLALSYVNLGAMQIAKGDRDAAESAFRRAVDAAPRSALAHIGLANFLWSGGRADEAERELKIALEIEPKSPAVNRALATLYLTRNRLTEAERYLKAFADLSGTVDSRLVLADYYVYSRKIPDATTILTSVAQEAAGYAAATIRLAALDVGAGRRTEAHGRLDEVLGKQPKNELALEAKSRLLLLERRNAEALTFATTLVDTNARSTRGRYVRALALEATGAADDAVKTYEDLLATTPSLVPVQAKLAAHYLARRNYKSALPLAQQVVKARPQSGAAHLLYAKALFGSGDLGNAERELLTLSKAMPSSAEVHTWIGLLHQAKGDPKNARRSFQKALELEPDSSVALAGLVSADLAERNPASALARIEARLNGNRNDPRLLMLSGMAHVAARDFRKAETAYRRVLDLDANNIEAYTRLGALYLMENRLEEARKSFEEMARHQKTPVAAETMVGIILTRQNRANEGREHFERALQLDPRAAVAANNLAWDYANNGGNLDIALQLAQTAKAELPDSASVTDTLGWIYYRKGLVSLAVTTLREAVQQDPSNANIQYHLGLAYLKNGNKLEARSTLQHVLKLSPQFREADEIRRVLTTLAG